MQFREDFYRDKICAFTKGFRPINNNGVELKACDSDRIEGVRWSRGFTTDRHVVEFIYPVHLRAPGARVGLGTVKTPLGGKKEEVIGSGGTYAVELMNNESITGNRHIGKLLRSKVVSILKSINTSK